MSEDGTVALAHVKKRRTKTNANQVDSETNFRDDSQWTSTLSREEEPSKRVRNSNQQDLANNGQLAKSDLVINMKKRESEVRELAEAWGLLDSGSVEGDAESDEDAKGHAVKKGMGLGSIGQKEEPTRNTLEGRLERAKQRKKKLEPSIELSDWTRPEDSEDERIVTKGSRSERRSTRSIRVTRLVDRLDAQNGVIHPLANKRNTT